MQRPDILLNNFLQAFDILTVAHEDIKRFRPAISQSLFNIDFALDLILKDLQSKADTECEITEPGEAFDQAVNSISQELYDAPLPIQCFNIEGHEEIRRYISERSAEYTFIERQMEKVEDLRGKFTKLFSELGITPPNKQRG